MARIAILASGGGSNAESIIAYFKDIAEHDVALLLSNKKEAGVFNVAKRNNLPCKYIPNIDFKTGEKVADLLEHQKIDFIVLAGFLRKIPSILVDKFPKSIVNIHPALLPHYGGKGMYGMHVHTAVYEAKEKQSGMTIHYVNENYDEGNIIFQDFVNISPDDLPNDLSLIHI